MIVLDLTYDQIRAGKTVVCLGLFDGVHVGHQRLIRIAQEEALAGGHIACVHTFAEMPVKVLHPQKDILEITPLAEKLQVFKALALDVVAISHFTKAMASMHAEDFFTSILMEKLRAVHVVAGFDHRFGHHSEADAGSLAKLCERYGMGSTIVSPVKTPDGHVISSTAIREAVRRHDYVRASEMLGRPYGA